MSDKDEKRLKRWVEDFHAEHLRWPTVAEAARAMRTRQQQVADIVDAAGGWMELRSWFIDDRLAAHTVELR